MREVQRNKVRVAAGFLASQQLKLDSIAIPNHLLPTGDSRVEEMRKQLREIGENVKKTKEDFKKLSHDLLGQISRSEDEVSKRLADIFSRAARATREEFERAAGRKRVGDPPGKRSDSLGDQINWEQILTKWKDDSNLWIITRDSDYSTEHGGKMFLNALLSSELVQLYGPKVEVFCFDNILDAFKHFSETAKVKADKLPTPEETKQIKKEQQSLPPLGWLTGYDDGGFSAIQNVFRSRDSELLRAALGSQIVSEEVIFPVGPGDSGEKL